MHNRSLLIALGACALLVLVALWQLSLPNEPAKVVRPDLAEARLDADPDDTPLEARLDEAPLAEDLRPRAILPPPPPPPVENDPRKGRVWLRLLDSRTNRPVANMGCELIRLEFHGTYQYDPFKTNIRRATDADGLMPLTAIEQAHDGTDKSLLDFVYSGQFVIQFHVPVPTGWQPVSGIYEIAEQLEEVCSAPRDSPIDFLVAPAADLRIVARDEWGQALMDADVGLMFVEAGIPAEEWLPLWDTSYPSRGAEDWPEYVNEMRRACTRSFVRATFDGKLAEGSDRSANFADDSGAKTANSGILLRGLPCVRIGAFAWQRGYGFGDGTIDLAPGKNELNVYLRTVGAATLIVRIEWRGEPLPESVGASIRLFSTGPCGRSELVQESPEAHDFYFDAEPNGTTVWNGVITDVPAGVWWIEGGVPGSVRGSALVQLLPGETRLVTLYTGDGAWSKWTPILRHGGKPLEEASLRLLGGELTEPTSYNVSIDAETGQPETLDLVAGEYTVWVPTLQPFRFMLNPGDSRTDIFELQVLTVRFSIEAPLARLLDAGGGAVQLNIFPRDAWYDAEDHLRVLDAEMRARDEEFDQLRPGEIRSWTIPVGDYDWQLVGADQQIDGRMEFTGMGSQAITFGLNSLPGFELLEIEFVGFGDDKLPSLGLEDDCLVTAAIYAFRSSRWSSDYSTDVSAQMPSSFAKQVLRSADGRFVYAFGARGGVTVVLHGDYTYAQMRATFPGKLALRPSMLETQRYGVVVLGTGKDEDQTTSYHVSAFHEHGEYGEYTGGDEVEMLLGRVSLMVTRSVNNASHGSASVQVMLTGQRQTLDLSVLVYDPYARVDFVFRGRGSPENPFDAWWYGEDAYPQPLLVALDQSIGGAFRLVSLGKPDKLMPEGRLEFSFNERCLPAGRYRVIPWHGAPDKYCVSFTLTPGQNPPVIVQGG